MLSGWEIGPQQNRLANQNKGLAISSVGSNIWHGGGRRCNHRLWSTNAQHVLLQSCKYLGEGSRRNEAHIILSACIQSPVMLVNVLWAKSCGTVLAQQSMIFLRYWNAVRYFLSSAIHDVSPCWNAAWYCLISATHDVPQFLKRWRLRVLGVDDWGCWASYF